MKAVKIISKVVVLSLLTTSLIGCGKVVCKSNLLSEEKYVAVIGKSAYSDFWLKVKKGALDAAKEKDIKMTFEGPDKETNVENQINLVKEAIDNDADAILVAPTDKNALDEVIKEADAKGIKVITIDSDAACSVQKSFVATDNYSAGAIIARKSEEEINYNGNIIVIAHNSESDNGQQRKNGFIDEINENKNSMNILSVDYCDNDRENAKKKTIDRIQENSKLDLIYATNEITCLGVCDALKETGKENDIKVMAIDAGEDEIGLIRDGVIDGVVAQNPYNIGYLGMRNAVKLIRGETIEKRIDTGATFVTKDNLEDENVQALLYP